MTYYESSKGIDSLSECGGEGGDVDPLDPCCTQ